tara:strand:+ start:2880 stop:3755 length:876 start_codon:yes stop_codon:yes gene_type:complete
MFVASLISPSGMLDESLVDSLRNAWGGGVYKWLSVDEAAEFELDRIPDNRWKVWQDLQAMQVDLIFQLSHNRRKKMLLADMDSTMIEQECIDELADEAGIGEHTKAITARAMNGELDFEEALTERVSRLKGEPASIIERVLSERITFMPGGAVVLATMKANGGYAALVSGGFTAFTEKVADSLGFDEHQANTLIIKEGFLTGKVGYPILGCQAKVDAMEKIASRIKIKASDIIAVGDGANDLGMLAHAGTGVALHAKPSVAAKCDVRINFGDLTALLFLQGYDRQEFVELD